MARPRAKALRPTEQLEAGAGFYAGLGLSPDHFAAMWHSFNVGQLLVTDLNTISRRHGLSIADFHLLAALLIEAPAALRASDLTGALNVSNTVLSDRVSRLAAGGLLRRERSGTDGRAFDLTITPDGAAKVEAVGGDLERDGRFVRHFRALAAEDQAALGRVMGLLHTALDRDFVSTRR